MIEFYCENCGQKISAPNIFTGESRQCPRCKNNVIVPDAKSAESATKPDIPTKPQIGSKYSDFELTLLNVREEYEIKNRMKSQSDDSEKTAENKKEREEKSKKAQYAEERTFPWIIDIFLYPFSLSGLIHLIIFAGVLTFMNIVKSILPLMWMCFFSLVHLVVRCLLFLYFFWYFAECIRDSADGWVRAPQGMGALPDLSDMFRQAVNTIGCLTFFLMPFGIYILHVGRIDIIALLLLIPAIFFYPIGFLSVVLHDSVSGLDPRVLFRSIRNTVLPYLGLVLLFVFIVWLTGTIFIVVTFTIFLGFVLRFVMFYAAFIFAHLTGRFYWRYREKLKWNLLSDQEQRTYD